VARSPASKKAPARKPWTKDDVKLLKSMARKEPASKIAKTLKRTEGATRQKATALGVSLNTARKRAPAKKVAGAKVVATKKAAPAKKAAPVSKAAPVAKAAKKAAPVKRRGPAKKVAPAPEAVN